MPARTPPSTSPPDICSPGLPSTAMVARWDAAATSLAVIFLDTSLLNDSTWLPSQPTLQPMALEDVQQMLSGALKSLEPASGVEGNPSPATPEPKPSPRASATFLKRWPAAGRTPRLQNACISASRRSKRTCDNCSCEWVHATAQSWPRSTNAHAKARQAPPVWRDVSRAIRFDVEHSAAADA